MSANKELQSYQRRQLYNLLLIREGNKNTKISHLDALLSAIEAEMDEEDIAYVEKKVATFISKNEVN